MDYVVLQSPAMAPKERVLTIRVDRALSDGLQAMQDRHGTKISDQVRKALSEWLVRHGALKADRKRVSPRKRP